MIFLAAKDADDHVLGHIIHAIAKLDDLVVLRDGALLGRDDTFDDGDDVRGILARLKKLLAAWQVERAGTRPPMVLMRVASCCAC